MKKIFISIFAILFLGIFIINLITPDKLLSETENKKLQQMPEVSVENIMNGKFEDQYETYVSDQFILRDKWVAFKTFIDKNILLKKEINDIYIGNDNYLFEKHENIENKEQKLNKLEKFINQYPNTFVMIAPTSDEILKDKIKYMPTIDEYALLKDISSIVNDKYIDVYSTLNKNKDKYIYYMTDHHWTTYGSYLAYIEFCNKLNIEPLTFKFETISDNFLGTLHSRLNIPVKEDIIEKANPIVAIEKVVYDQQKEINQLFFDKYLSTKNQYGYFLDDNHGLIEITTNNKNGKTLTIVKDSYANCMISMLVNHYEKINIIDKRYFAAGYEAYLDESSDILILYNVISFFENF